MVREDTEYPTYTSKHPEDLYYIFGSKDNTPLESTIVNKIRAYALQNDLENGAASALIYLTSSRLREIARYEYTGIASEDIKIKLPGITLGQITIEEKEGGEEQWLCIITRVEKHFNPKPNMTLEERRQQLEKIEYKKMKILIDEQSPLYPLIEVVKLRIDELTGEAKDVNDFNNNSRKFKDIELYTLSGRQLGRIMVKHFKIHPHLLRHWRCKHLTELYGYSTSELERLIKWSGQAMAMTYTEASDKGIEEKERRRVMERKQNL